MPDAAAPATRRETSGMPRGQGPGAGAADSQPSGRAGPRGLLPSAPTEPGRSRIRRQIRDADAADGSWKGRGVWRSIDGAESDRQSGAAGFS